MLSPYWDPATRKWFSWRYPVRQPASWSGFPSIQKYQTNVECLNARKDRRTGFSLKENWGGKMTRAKPSRAHIRAYNFTIHNPWTSTSFLPPWEIKKRTCKKKKKIEFKFDLLHILIDICKNIYWDVYICRLISTHVFPCSVSWENLETMTGNMTCQ